MQACAAGARYATFLFDHVLLSHSSLGSTSSVRQMVGHNMQQSSQLCKLLPRSLCIFPSKSSTDHILHTKPENGLYKTDTCILGQKYSFLSAK